MAIDIDSNLQKAYSNFIYKVEKKYNSEKKISLLKSLNKKIELALDTKKLPKKNIKLLGDLQKLNYNHLFNGEFIKKRDEQDNLFHLFPIAQNFSKKVIIKENIFLEGWIWYTYKFSHYKFFPKEIQITKADLLANDINTNTDIILTTEDNNIAFVSEYEKIKLIHDDIIFWIPNKFNFLKELQDDKKALNYETDELFIKLQWETQALIKWLPREEKIEKIYDYILENITYSFPLDLSDKKIFSWIDTYKNKDWVCEGYAKLFSYMLSFAGIDDHEVIRGFVIDAEDFPNIWHAWVRIGNGYYDPTFDDPIGIAETRNSEQYIYYKLPKDLFYTNRFDYIDSSEELKVTSLSYRTNLVKKNRTFLINKYKWENYNILKPFIFRVENNLNPYETITIKKLQNILPFYEINDFSFNFNWEKKIIKHLQYYTLQDNLLEPLLEQLNYNLDNYSLFKWQLDNWQLEYRLGYNIEFF